MKFLWILAVSLLLPLGCSSPMSVDTDRKVTSLDPSSGGPGITHHWMQAKSFSLFLKSKSPDQKFEYDAKLFNDDILIDTSSTTVAQIRKMIAFIFTADFPTAPQSYISSITIQIDTLTVGVPISLKGDPAKESGAEITIMSYNKIKGSHDQNTVLADGQKKVMKLWQYADSRADGTITVSVSLLFTDPTLFPDTGSAQYEGKLSIQY